ncbi:pyridoxal phosphate-dependent transferase [Aspergillus granulosus]|uniref:Pyridoxal phosphate-dependent transferase n=1 Tax=Aspergillus granulosus TaxID=176169 RepID=A0ABR4I561_9EURO
MAINGATPMVDFSHHLNRKSKARHPSPLKDIIKYMGVEGMISLAGGLPHPMTFPLQQATFDCLPPSASISSEGPGEGPENALSITLGRGASSPGNLDLTQFLQYGTGTGNKHLLSQCRALTEKVHSPPGQYDCLLHPGNTNAWAKVVGMLCEDDDFVLVEEYTYPSAQALWIPLGIRAVPVPADMEGIRASDLRSLLANWDEKGRGARRPRVIYLVGVGSNPTGITISRERRKEVYDVCVEFDIIIVEDDPYYFLQYPSYNHPTSTSTDTTSFTALGADSFLKTLIPSFLSLDTQSRVIRLESFSKTLFPGLRVGYFIAHPVFIERLLRATEVETQDPAGLSQAFVLGLLNKWGVDGYLEWLQRLQNEYRVRRDWIVDAFHKEFLVVPAEDSPVPDAQGLIACLKTSRDGEQGLRPVFSFVDPGAGMFVWCKFYFGQVSRFAELQNQSTSPTKSEDTDPEQIFATELWKAWAGELVLLTPGSYYHPWQGKDKVTTRARGADAGTAHFRFSFATPTVCCLLSIFFPPFFCYVGG